MNIACSTQAADGMSLARDSGFVVDSMKELPSAVSFWHAPKLAGSLKELRDAPRRRRGIPRASAVFCRCSRSGFCDLVGENILGRKPELGKNSRTTGAFAASYKSRVLPEFLSVVADPTIASYHGESLLGHYEIDDEGVPAQTGLSD